MRSRTCHANQLADSRALIPDRGSQFIDSFEPVRTPVANTFAGRWAGLMRRELLDRTIIWNQHQLRRLMVD